MEESGLFIYWYMLVALFIGIHVFKFQIQRFEKILTKRDTKIDPQQCCINGYWDKYGMKV